MADRRKRNVNWYLHRENGNCWESKQYAYMQLAVLMDIRDELQTLNAVFRCPNALAIPDLLRAIRKNTTKTRKPRTKKDATR